MSPGYTTETAIICLKCCYFHPYPGQRKVTKVKRSSAQSGPMEQYGAKCRQTTFYEKVYPDNFQKRYLDRKSQTLCLY